MAASDSTSDSRVPIVEARAGPERAARKATGDSASRPIAGATLSTGGMSAVGLGPVVLAGLAVTGAGGAGGAGTSPNSAFTLCASPIVSVQVSVPEQSPLQPVKVDPLSGAAVNVTPAPAA